MDSGMHYGQVVHGPGFPGFQGPMLLPLPYGQFGGPAHFEPVMHMPSNAMGMQIGQAPGAMDWLPHPPQQPYPVAKSYGKPQSKPTAAGWFAPCHCRNLLVHTRSKSADRKSACVGEPEDCHLEALILTSQT